MAERGRVECVDIATAVPQLADNFIDRTSRQSRANCCHELAVNDTLPPDSFRQEARAGAAESGSQRRWAVSLDHLGGPPLEEFSMQNQRS